MTQQSKYKGWAIPAIGAAAVLSLGLFAAGCGGGGGGTAASTTTTTTGAASGGASRGPFQKNSTVNAYQATDTATVIDHTTTDEYGNYTLSNLPVNGTGVILVWIHGSYTDEFGKTKTGGDVYTTINAASVSSTTTLSAYANAATDIVAALIKEDVAAGKTVDAAAVTAANNKVVTALGLTAGTDLTTLNPVDTSGANAAENIKLLAVAAAISKVVTDGTYSLAQITAEMVSNVKAGKGAASGTSALATSLSAGISTYSTLTELNKIANNLAAVVKSTSGGSMATTLNTQFTKTGSTLAADLTAAATKQASSTVTALTIMKFSTDTYNSATVGADGVVSPTNLTASKSAATITLTFGKTTGDYYSNYAAGTYTVSFDMYAADHNSSRVVYATLDKLNVTIASSGAISSISVPANAVLDLYGTDVKGKPIGSATSKIQVTNLASNAVGTVSGTTLSVGLATLISTANAKLTTAHSIGALINASTYDFSFTFGGFNVNNAVNGTLLTSGGKISGVIKTK